jgi:hypothetical protein
VKALFRAVILIAAAGGFCIAMSTAAQADVVEPTSAYQPASTVLLDKEAAADLPGATRPEAPKPQDAVVEPEAAVIEQPEIAATPAPEQQVVRQVPTAVVPNFQQAPTLIDHVVHPLRIGVEHLKTSLGRVVSACEVAFGTGAGGPVFVLAVLSLAIPFIRRRVSMTRWANDEDVPEFLYVWELTPPG